jgi:hypothetical protein
VIRAVLPDPPWSFCIFVPELVPTRPRQTRVHAERPDNGKHHSPPPSFHSSSSSPPPPPLFFSHHIQARRSVLYILTFIHSSRSFPQLHLEISLLTSLIFHQPIKSYLCKSRQPISNDTFLSLSPFKKIQK